MTKLPMKTNMSPREFSKGKTNYMLHEASRAKPPLQVISDLIYYDRNVLGEVDKNGQTPLHIATANNASFKVIEYLTNEFPGAAGMCDHCGKVPLILLCENYCDKQDCDLVDSEDEFIELSGILISASSRSITVEDETGCTALEYAIMNNVGILAVKFLQLQAKKETEKLRINLSQTIWRN